MHRILYILFLVVIVSCDPSNNDENRGQLVLSSAFDFNNATIHGYNFELKSFTQFPSGLDPVPDIIVDKFTLLNGDILPGFTSPENNNGFALISESGSLAESLSFFEDYGEFDTSLPLVSTTDTIRTYQVWVLKTRQDKYVKLNIRDIRILNNAGGDYIEVSLDYYYQDDETPVFFLYLGKSDLSIRIL